MRIAANSLTASLLATAVFAVCLAPLANLSDTTCTLLAYGKFSLLIVATFLARFTEKRAAAWWFGFATLGWASLLISGPANSFGEIRLNSRVDLANLASTAAVALFEGWLKSTWQGSMKQMSELRQLTAVVQLWFLILASSTGGWLGLLFEDRKNRRLANTSAFSQMQQESPQV